MAIVVSNPGKIEGFHPAHACTYQGVEQMLEECKYIREWREGDIAYLSVVGENGKTVLAYLHISFWENILKENNLLVRPWTVLVVQDGPTVVRGKGMIFQVSPQDNGRTHEELLAMKGTTITVGRAKYKIKGAECMQGACGYKGSVGLLVDAVPESVLKNFPPSQVIPAAVNIGPKDLSNPAPLSGKEGLAGPAVNEVSFREIKPHEQPLVAEDGKIYTKPRFQYPYQAINHVLEQWRTGKIHRYFEQELIERWRPTGLLDGVVEPGSREEMTLVILLENQRLLGREA